MTSGVQFSYAVLRVVPHPHTGGGAPVGVVVQSRPAEFIGAIAVTDPGRLRVLAPDADVELLARYLRSCVDVAAGRESAGEIALLSGPERFYWLTAPRSDVIQPTPVRHGTTRDPRAELCSLFLEHVGPPIPE